MADVYVGDRAYDKADVKIAMLGDLPAEVSEISYGKEVEHQLNFGMAAKPTSWSKGKESYSGSITMSMHEVVKLEDAIIVGEKDLTRIKPFKIFISYINESQKFVTDKVFAKFKNHGREVTDDMGLSKQFELFVLDVEFNIV